MIRALIFDMDGLLVDTEPLYWEVARKMAAARGKSVIDATLRRMMGRSRVESMTIFAADIGIDTSPADLLVEREKLMLERYTKGIEPMSGVRETIARFHGRLKLAIATSSPRKFTDLPLPALGIEKYFEVIQTGDDVTNGKPDPEIYLKCIHQLRVQPADCMVLEDSHAGALSGHRAGAYVIAVPSALTAAEDFSFANARAADLFDAAKQIDSMLPATAKR